MAMRMAVEWNISLVNPGRKDPFMRIRKSIPKKVDMS
jgi:hypothetical protein